MLQLDLRFQMVRERSRDRRAHFNSNTLGLWPTLTWGRREDMVSLYFLFFFRLLLFRCTADVDRKYLGQ